MTPGLGALLLGALAARPPRQPQPAWAVGSALLAQVVIGDDNLPFQPMLVAVVNAHGVVIGTGVARSDDPGACVREALQEALARIGDNSPRVVTVTQAWLKPQVESLLPGVSVTVGRNADLDALLAQLITLSGAGPSSGRQRSASGQRRSRSSRRDEEPGGILTQKTYLTEDLTPAALGSFFAACKELYQRQPWTLFADSGCLFSVTSRALAMERWCGCVLGQLGESYGVLLFESSGDYEHFIEAAAIAQMRGAPPPGLMPSQWAISFEPLDVLTRSLVGEIEQHGWPVAPGDGYPVPLHIQADTLRHLPLRLAELARLEAVARALSRLIDNLPELVEYWTWSDPGPLRRQYLVPVQDRRRVSVSISLLPRQHEDEDGQLDDQEFI